MKLGAALLVSLVALGTSACGGGRPAAEDTPPAPDASESKGLAEQTADSVVDTATVRQAQAAANAVVRDMARCDDRLRERIAAANQALDDAEGRIRTAAGRSALEVLRLQVQKVADTCP